ncbi:hypothetical protein ACFLUC_02950 [Chloroflexota bacterium]
MDIEMESIRAQLKNPLVVGIAGLVVGIFIGLVVLGWWLWPVTWVDATPADLTYDQKVEYMRVSVEAFGNTGDAITAKERYDSLGEGAAEILAEIQQNPDGLSAEILTVYGTAVAGVLSEAQSPTQPVPEVTESTEVTTGEESSFLSSVWPLLCLIGMILAAGTIAIFIMRSRGIRSGEPSPQAQAQPAATHHEAPVVGAPTPASEPPLGQFMASYRLGDDLFDDSFSIDSISGEFMGECGVGISETIGVGDPKKVTAYEVWLFDKNDIQTVTKVLMSAHAFGDNAIRQRLAAKGEPVMVAPGGETILETQTLQLVARVVDSAYGDGALPEESYFERLTLELVVWQKI